LVLGANTAAGCLLVYFYVWLVVDPRLVHHGLGILSYYHPFSFRTGWPFFADHLQRPGGLVEYAARALSQCYAFGWAGGLIITGCAWHGCWSTNALSHLARRGPTGPLRFVPAVLILVLYGSYSHPLHALLSLVVALSGFVFFVRWALGTP
jgi:hypothetical protein